MNDVNSKLDALTIGLDMRGCPNRCRHCWMGHAPNRYLAEADLRFVHDAFRPYARRLELDTWTREPDFADNYRALWALRAELSDALTPHFELMSVWCAARDPGYVPWLREMGVRRVQLTLFGGEALTDITQAAAVPIGRSCVPSSSYCRPASRRAYRCFSIRRPRRSSIRSKR